MSDDIDREVRRGTDFLKKSDRKLAAVIRRIGPLNHRSQRSGFEALARIVTGQQLSGKAAETIYTRVRRALPKGRMTIRGLRSVDDETLRGCGLSAAKTRTLRDLVAKIESRELRIQQFSRMTDEKVAAMITNVKGLGPWSAQMYLMFTLRRLDIFAAGDLGIQNALQRLYGLDRNKDDLEEFAERWRPYRTIACWYLWASLNNRPIKK